MNEERRQILQMLQEGTITADQAMELLQAMDEDGEGEETAVPLTTDAYAEPLSGDILPANDPPDLDRYRQFWKIPFLIGLAFLVLFGFWLRGIYLSSEGAITFGFLCVWSFFMLAFLATLLALFSRRAAWLHVRVQEKEGHRIAISLPLPLGLVGWGIQVAYGFVDEKTRSQLDMASAFLTAAKEELNHPDARPMTIDVDDNDGDRVQVYIG
jgi:hypothetical protein